MEKLVATHTEKLDELSSETYKRVNDHAGSLASLHKVLASNFADRPTLGTVESLIADAVASGNEEVLDQLRDMVDNHTHVVEHSERVLLREDGSRVVVDNGPLTGIKVEDDGRQNHELWSRIQTLTAEQKALHRRLADYESRSRSPTRQSSPTGSPSANDVHPTVSLIKQRMQKLETAHERTVSELKTVSAKVDLTAHAARAGSVQSPLGSSLAAGKIDESRLEEIITHVGTMLDEKANRQEVMYMVGDLERKLTDRSSGSSRQGVLKSPESEAFGPGLEGKLRAHLKGKADKSTVEEMFRSLSKALDSKASHAELQAALKEKLDARTYLSSLSGRPGSVGGTPQAAPGHQRQGTASPLSVSSAGRDRSLNISMTSPLSAGDATTPGSAFKRYSAARANLEEQARAIFNTADYSGQ